MEPIWMEHEETGNRALLPDLMYWRAKGWKPADGPAPEPDLLHDPEEPVEQHRQVNPDSQAADAPPTPAKRASTAESTPVGEPADEPAPKKTLKSAAKSEEK